MTEMTTAIEIGRKFDEHDVYITYNGRQWSGFTCRSLADLEKLYYAIGAYLQEHTINEEDTEV